MTVPDTEENPLFPLDLLCADLPECFTTGFRSGSWWQCICVGGSQSRSLPAAGGAQAKWYGTCGQGRFWKTASIGQREMARCKSAGIYKLPSLTAILCLRLAHCIVDKFRNLIQCAFEKIIVLLTRFGIHISLLPLINSSREHLNPQMTSSLHLWLYSAVG